RTREFHERRAARLVGRIVRLGPTFVRRTLAVAARADLVPEPHRSQLGTLTDQVPPVPWEQARRVITEAYGAPPEGIFTRIDEVPVAAASLGQVHRATWKGRTVAVKVLRPAIEQVVAKDLASSRAIAAWA